MDSSEALARQLAVQTHRDPSELAVYRFRNGEFVEAVPTAEGIALSRHRVALYEAANRSLALPIVAVAGIILGFLFPLSIGLLPQLLFCLSGMSLVKLLVACPSCPQAQFLGIDVAAVGVAGFLGLGVLALALRGRIRWPLTICLTAILLGQLFFGAQVAETCTPCTVIAGLAAFAITSLVGSSANWHTLPRTRMTLSWGMAVVLPSALWAAVAPNPGDLIPANAKMVNIGLAQPMNIANISALGLPKPGRAEVLYIGAAGCHPCEAALRAIDAIGLQGLTFAYIKAGVPDRLRPWTAIPNPSPVTVTPSILFVDKDGGVRWVESSLITGEDGMRAFAHRVTEFLSVSPPQGRGGGDKQK